MPRPAKKVKPLRTWGAYDPATGELFGSYRPKVLDDLESWPTRREVVDTFRRQRAHAKKVGIPITGPCWKPFLIVISSPRKRS